MTTNGPSKNPPIHIQSSPPQPSAKRASWPVTFGITAIFFGITGIMGSLPAGCAGGLASSLLPAGSSDASAAIHSVTRWFAVGSIVSTILSIMLLAIGIGLCQRRVWSLRLMWIWSVLNLGITVLAGVATYILSRQFLAGVQNHSRDLMISISSTDAAKISVALALAVLAVGWSSPIFLLIWLARPTIREETTQWR